MAEEEEVEETGREEFIPQVAFGKHALARYTVELGEEIKDFLRSGDLDLSFVIDRGLATSNLSSKQVQAIFIILDYAKEAYMAYKAGYKDMLLEVLDALADIASLLQLNKSKDGFQQQTLITERYVRQEVPEKEERKGWRERLFGGGE